MFEEKEVVVDMIIQAHRTQFDVRFLAPNVSVHVGYFTGTIWTFRIPIGRCAQPNDWLVC